MKDNLEKLRGMLRTPQVIKKFDAIVRRGEYVVYISGYLCSIKSKSNNKLNGPAILVFRTGNRMEENLAFFKNDIRTYYNVSYTTTSQNHRIQTYIQNLEIKCEIFTYEINIRDVSVID